MSEIITFAIAMLALPLLVCAIGAAAMLFFAYAVWVINMFGRLVERLIPSLRE